MDKKPTEEEEFEFNWVQARKNAGLSNYDVVDSQEGGGAKFMRKARENPFVPIGCVLTATCLSLGLMSMRHGNQKMSQVMMRARVVAQGFTVVAIVAGIGIKAAQEMAG